MASIGSIHAEAERRKDVELRSSLAPIFAEIEEIHRQTLRFQLRKAADREQELQAEIDHLRHLLRAAHRFLSESSRKRASEIAVITA